jgi:uncharacterized YigZ family protein
MKYNTYRGLTGGFLKNILLGGGAGYYEQKKSKFYGYCAPVETEAEARGVIERIRLERRDANHHVYAYGIVTPMTYTRHSDDGEPSGTAGLPVLNVFTKNNVERFVCVVSRIFGGTLLGTGGLVRAYSSAAKEAMTAAGVAPLIRYTSYEIIVPYPDWDKFNYEIQKAGLSIERTEFTDKCTAYVTVPETHDETFAKIIEMRNAKMI